MGYDFEFAINGWRGHIMRTTKNFPDINAARKFAIGKVMGKQNGNTEVIIAGPRGLGVIHYDAWNHIFYWNNPNGEKKDLDLVINADTGRLTGQRRIGEGINARITTKRGY